MRPEQHEAPAITGSSNAGLLASSRTDLGTFRLDVRVDGEAARVAPVGELDIATVGQLDAQLHDLRESGSGGSCSTCAG